MSHHKVEIQDVHYRYPDGYPAVNGLSLHIRHGESVGIIGANGAGKSTLLLLLMGLIFPSQGKIVIGDIPLSKKTLPLIRQRMSMVFQDPDDQLFMTTVFDDVAFGPRNLKLEEAEVTARVTQALARVGIPHLRDRAPYKLSGGEKRTAAIASVLSMDPDILVLDEPTASLDPQSRRRIMDLLKGFQHTKIITSHDLDMVLALCERAVVVKDGKIAADAPSLELLTQAELLESCGLELPLSLQGCPRCGLSSSAE
ncbi:MAG: energy-coupling factor ABC transporter ATP-binding protein [Peptococcaceae bacterium]|jgi:cobalt/nickel transport system ATP-binding protein|nr:energy-coupling factor ABC transporter ATP-binding protein [Peptococcaceae bacterium]